MNQYSPKSLKDAIKITNCLNELNVIEYNNKKYITESNLNSFIENNNISESIDGVISTINEFCNIGEINVITESVSDKNLVSIKEVMRILEAIDPDEVIKTSKGPDIFKEFINRIVAYITKHEYDEASELKSQIQQCDKVLEDIKEEKKKSKDKSKSSSYKFTLVYIYNLTKKIFNIFIAPFVIIPKQVKWPSWVTDFVGEFPFIGKTLQHRMETKRREPDVGEKAIDITVGALTSGIPGDIKNLYLSFKDYNELLSYYENKIKEMKSSLQRKLKSIEGNKSVKESNMYTLEEEVIPSSANSVNYITPEDLKGKHREVFHDDDVNDSLEVSPKIPITSSQDAILSAKANPANVVIAKCDGRYYIDYKDLQSHMQACDKYDYDDAIDSIVKHHPEEPGICPSRIKVVATQDDLDECSPDDIARLESSNVEFEVYSR